MRLNRYIAHAGLCSRRKADELIKKGCVCINGKQVTLPSVDVKETDTVSVNGRVISPQKHFYIALHKPAGYTCTTKDRFAVHPVTELIPKFFGRVFPAGRLDKNSTGLVILTNDGTFANRVTHPRFNIEKEYEVMVVPAFNPEHISSLTTGIFDGGEKLKAVSVRIVKNLRGKTILSLVIKEGKKREIRRMFSHLHYHILKLKRIRIGTIFLGGLMPGRYRFLTEKEIQSFYGD